MRASQQGGFPIFLFVVWASDLAPAIWAGTRSHKPLFEAFVMKDVTAI